MIIFEAVKICEIIIPVLEAKVTHLLCMSTF